MESTAVVASCPDEHLVAATNSKECSTSEREFSERLRAERLQHADNMVSQTLSSSQRRYVLTKDKVCDTSSVCGSRRLLDTISLELFEFSCQLQQLIQDMDSTDKILLGSHSNETAESGAGLWQKLQEERQHCRELVAKMLQKWDSMGLCKPNGGIKNDTKDSRTYLEQCGNRNTTSTKCQCQEVHRSSAANTEMQGEVSMYENQGHLKEDCVNLDKELSNESSENTSDNPRDENEFKLIQTIARLTRELEDMEEKQKTIIQERNGLQERCFEVDAELCSVEIERDLNKETVRYLEEQVSSVSSMLVMRDNELASIRKRYKCLNEAFLNSEELRESLEKGTTEMRGIIRDLEERLKMSKSTLSDNEGSLKQSGDFERLSTVDGYNVVVSSGTKLEKEISEEKRDVLENERRMKEGLQEMLANVRKERSLLLKELDGLKDVHRQQQTELEELREERHRANKRKQQWQQQQSKEQEQEQEQVQEQEQEQRERERRERERERERKGEEEEEKEQKIRDLKKSVSELSRKILLLQDENKKLEEEIYEQLEVLEKMEAENIVMREKRQDIKATLKKINFETVEELFERYSILEKERQVQEEKIKQYQDRFAESKVLGKETTSSSSYSVPRSEYVKLKFQLRSLVEEMKFLKEVKVPETVNDMTVARKAMEEERVSLKNENKAVKKWLKTIKESINAVTEDEEEVTKRFESILLESQLHEVRISLSEKQHEADLIRKENENVVADNLKQEEALNVLKRRLVEDQEVHKNKVEELKESVQELEKQLRDERESHLKKSTTIALLEEQTEELRRKFENVSQKLKRLQKEKEIVDKELADMKLDVLKYFRGVSLQRASELWNATKTKCSDYAKAIEQSKNSIGACKRDIAILTGANTELRKELSEVKLQLREERLNSEKRSDIRVLEKREVNRLHVVIQTLENERKREQELLSSYMKEKKEWENWKKQMDSMCSELQEAKMTLAEKEKECGASKIIIQELETTCQVYENEFKKNTVEREKSAFSLLTEDKIETKDSEQSEFSDGENDSAVENFRQLQEIVQGNLAMKMQVLQSRLGELMEALCSCQKLNVSLQERLHSVEMKHLADEGRRVDRARDDELDKLLKELSERESLIHEMFLAKSCPECRRNEDVIANSMNSECLRDTLSRYQEIMKCLRMENDNYDEGLATAEKTIAKQKEELAKLDYHARERECNGEQNEIETHISLDVQRNKCDTWTRDDVIKTITTVHKNQEFVIMDDEKALFYCSEDAISGAQAKTDISTKGDSSKLKEELRTITTKYVNLRAAFEGCQKRLKLLEDGQKSKKLNDDETVVMKRESLAYQCAPAVAIMDSMSRDGTKKSRSQRYCSQKEDIASLDFAELSFKFSESEQDSGLGTRDDRMVIEVTLVDSELDSEIQDKDDRNEEEYYKCCQLRDKIFELESKLSACRDEVHRVKVCSFEEMMNSENSWETNQNEIARQKQKLSAFEREREELTFQSKELEDKLFACRQEIQQIKICSLNERKKANDAIKDCQDTDSQVKSEIEKTKWENTDLCGRITELEEKVFECANETWRVKVCSFKERETLEGERKKLEKEAEEYREKGEAARSKLTAQEERSSAEIQRIKLRSQYERQSFKSLVQRLQDTNIDLQKRIEKLETEKETGSSKQQDFEASLLSRDEETNERETSFSDESQNLRKTDKQFQDIIKTLETRVEEENRKNDNAKSRIKDLEECLESSTEETERIRVCFSKEKQNLESDIRDLGNMILTMEKNIEDQNREKDDRETTIRQLEAKIMSLNNEMIEIKLDSFNERNKLQETVNTQEGTIASMKSLVQKYTSTNDQAEFRARELENQIRLSQEETQRVKICSFDERQKFEKNMKEQSQELLEIKKIFDSEKTAYQSNTNELKTKVKELENEKLKFFCEVQLAREELDIERKSCKDLRDRIAGMKQEMEAQCVENSKVHAKCNDLRQENQLLKLKVLEYDKKDIEWRKKLEKTGERNDNVERKNTQLMSELCDERKCTEKKERVSSEKMEKIHQEFNQLLKEHEDERSKLDLNIQELQQSKEELKVISEKLLAKERALNELRGVVESIRKENSSLKQGLAGIEDVFALKTKAERLAHENESHKNEAKKTKDEGERNVTEMNKSDEVVKEILKECKSWKERFDQFEQEMSGIAAREAALEDKKRCLEKDVIKQNEEISALGKRLAELEDEKESLARDLIVKNEKISALRIRLTKLGEEKQCTEELTSKQDEAISFLHTSLTSLQDERECLEKVIKKREEENVGLRTTMVNLEEDKRCLECSDSIRENEEVSVVKTRVAKLENEKLCHENEIKKRDEEIVALKRSVVILKKDSRCLESDSMKRNEEMSVLKTRVTKLEDEKRSFLNEIEKREEESSLLKSTLNEIENEKRNLESDMAKQRKEISVLTRNVTKLTDEKGSMERETIKRDEEMSVLKTNVANLTEEKRHGESEVSELKVIVNKLNDDIEYLRNDIIKKEEEVSDFGLIVTKLEGKARRLEGGILQRDEEISVLRKRMATLEHDKRNLESDVIKQSQEISALILTVTKHNSEKQSAGSDGKKKDEVISVLQTSLTKLKEEKLSLENDKRKRDEEIFALKTILVKFEDSKKSLESELQIRDKELSILKTNFTKLEDEKTGLAGDIEKQHKELSDLTKSVTEFKNSKKSLDRKIATRDEELSFLKTALTKLEVEKGNWEKGKTEQHEEISVLSVNVANLEDSKRSVENDITTKDEELSLLRTTLTKLEDEKKDLENGKIEQLEEISALKANVSKLENTKKSLESEIQTRNEEIFILKTALTKLEDANTGLERDMGKHHEELTVFRKGMTELEDSKKSLEREITTRDKKLSFIRSTLTKLEDEKKYLENGKTEQHEEITVLKGNVAKLEDLKRSLESEVQTRDEKISILKTTLVKLEAVKITLESDIEKQREETSTLRIRVTKLESEIKERVEEVSFLKTTLAKYEDDKKAFESNIAKQLGNTFNIEKDSLCEEIKAGHKELENCRGEINNLHQEIENWKEKVHAHEEKTNVLERDYQELQKEIENKEKLIIEANEQYKDNEKHLEEMIEKYKEEIHSLEQEVQKQKNEVILLRTSIENFKNQNTLAEKEIRRLMEERHGEEENYLRGMKKQHEETDIWKQKVMVFEKDMTILQTKVEELEKEKKDTIDQLTKNSKDMQRKDGLLQELIEVLRNESESLKEKDNFSESQTHPLKNTEHLKHERETSENKLRRIKEVVQILIQEKTTLEKKISKFEENISVLTKKTEDLAHERESLKNRLEQTDVEKNDFARKTEDDKNEIQKLQDENKTLRENLHDYGLENASLKSLINQLEKVKIEMEDDIKLLSVKEEDSKKELDEYKNVVEEFQKENRNLNEIVSSKEREVGELKVRCEELSKLKDEMKEMKLRLKQDESKHKNELEELKNVLKSSAANELQLKEKLTILEKDAISFKSKNVEQEKRNDGEMEQKELLGDIESSRQTLKNLRKDIEEVSKRKFSLENELRDFKQVVEKKTLSLTEEKEKCQQDVHNLKEIVNELVKGKLTLIEEIARLSDQKKQGQEMINCEVARIRKEHGELRAVHEKTQEDRCKLEFQVSSLKISLDTLQSAYEQCQDENKQHERRLQELRGETMKSQDKQKLTDEVTRLNKQINVLDNKLKISGTENKQLSTSLTKTEQQLLALEREYETCKNENSILSQHLREEQETKEENSHNSETGSSSNQVTNLRKKLKEFRSKLSEEKKQGEVHRFEIKSLKEKVERLTKNEKEIEVQLENNRKKFLEMKTEKDALEMDLESVNKRKKRDMEGYTIRLESLERELRLCKERGMEQENGRQMKEAMETWKNEKKILEMKLTSSNERYKKENDDLKNSLKLLQERYGSVTESSKKTLASNQNEILKLKKSLSTVEREYESKEREVERLRHSLTKMDTEKEQIEISLDEKNSEAKKWKKEAFDYKAEVNFLRGALNILEKEGPAKESSRSDDVSTNA